MVDSKTFQMYDYGYLENEIHYGQVCLKQASNIQEMSSATVSITVSIRLPRCLHFSLAFYSLEFCNYLVFIREF